MFAAAELPIDLVRCLEFSRYAARWCAARPQLLEHLRAGLTTPLDWSSLALDKLEHASAAVELQRDLRNLRQRVLLTTLVRDLSGRASLAEVCANVTRLAEVSVKAASVAHHRWLAEVHGEPIGVETGREGREPLLAA